MPPCIEVQSLSHWTAREVPGPIFFFFCFFSAVLGLHCCVGFSVVVASSSYALLWCTGFSCCEAQTPVVAVARLNCSKACGILPDQGWNPCLLHWQADSLPLSHQGSPLRSYFKTIVCVFVAQSCPTVCNPIDCSLPGSSVHEILQARILEWVAISCSMRLLEKHLSDSSLMFIPILKHLINGAMGGNSHQMFSLWPKGMPCLAMQNRGPRTTPPPHTPHPGPRRRERTKGLGGGGAGTEEEREGVAVGGEGNGGPRGDRHPGFAAAAGATGARLLTGSGCLWPPLGERGAAVGARVAGRRPAGCLAAGREALSPARRRGARSEERAVALLPPPPSPLPLLPSPPPPQPLHFSRARSPSPSCPAPSPRAPARPPLAPPPARPSLPVPLRAPPASRLLPAVPQPRPPGYPHLPSPKGWFPSSPPPLPSIPGPLLPS